MGTQGKFKQKLLSLKGQEFTGRLDIKTDQGREWRLYFYLSKLVWADGGYHPYRLWQRLLSQYCPNLDQNKINLEEAKHFECWSYYAIIKLLERSQITKPQAIQLIKTRILEALFDLFQTEAQGHVLKCRIVTLPTSVLWELGLKVSVVLLTINDGIKEVQFQWSEWRKRGLTNYSPYKAPLIKNHEFFKKEFTKKTYNNVSILFNGKLPLTEIATKLNKDILKLAMWLKRYIDKGLIELVNVRDNPLKITLLNLTTDDYQVTEIKPPKKIACIDDSVQICKIMEYIIKKEGYEFIGIQDPLKALSELIKCKPDLIFLDLIMPVVNGYEICSQIRRISQLKDIPVIILTGNHGIIDRARSKMVGSSAFLTKPIDETKVIKAINYFFLEKNKSNSTNVSKKIKLDTQIAINK